MTCFVNELKVGDEFLLRGTRYMVLKESPDPTGFKPSVECVVIMSGEIWNFTPRTQVEKK